MDGRNEDGRKGGGSPTGKEDRKGEGIVSTRGLHGARGSKGGRGHYRQLLSLLFIPSSPNCRGKSARARWPLFEVATRP